MLNLARLFGKSPFAPLQTHMEKVYDCIKKLQEIFDAIVNSDYEKVETMVQVLSKLEHEADLTKNDIRNHLPKSIFLPIDRSQLLDILAIQDSIADKAEEIGHLLILKPLEPIEHSFKELKSFFEKNKEAFVEVYNIMKEMDNLLEASFGGMEAQKVKAMIDHTSYKEYESDIMKHKITKTFFEHSEHLKAPSFYLFMKLMDEIGALSHISEKLAMRIRMILDLN